MSTKRSRVHPKYKTKYRLTNWSDYDRGLIRRGDLTLWISPEAIAGRRITRSSATRHTGERLEPGSVSAFDDGEYDIDEPRELLEVGGLLRGESRRSVSAVSMAVSEYRRWPPRAPQGFGHQASIASFEIQRVHS